jgi:hypothetical protein
LTAATPTSPATRRLLNSIARITRRALKFIFKTITAAILAVMILAMLLPPAAFAWRASQPMNDPLFNGLSFLQVIQLRDSQYKVTVARYNAAHPTSKYPVPPAFCSWSEIARSITVSALLAEVCTLANCSGLAVIPTGLGSYPTAIWANFEYNLVDQYNRALQQPAEACRLPPFFPPPGRSCRDP